MPTNTVPNLSQSDLKKLHKLLNSYGVRIRAEQPLAADLIYKIMEWVADDIDPPDDQNNFSPRYGRR